MTLGTLSTSPRQALGMGIAGGVHSGELHGPTLFPPSLSHLNHLSSPSLPLPMGLGRNSITSV